MQSSMLISKIAKSWFLSLTWTTRYQKHPQLTCAQKRIFIFVYVILPRRICNHIRLGLERSHGKMKDLGIWTRKGLSHAKFWEDHPCDILYHIIIYCLILHYRIMFNHTLLQSIIFFCSISKHIIPYQLVLSCVTML